MWYTLGDYTLDTQRYELCRADIPLPLQPKVFELLVYLIQHRDRVVTRQELFDTLWPEQFVSDDAMGVHTGEVIVGPIGTDPRQVALAVGDTTQMAELLLRLAEPGAIVLSAVTGQFVQDFVRLALVAPVHVPGVTASHTIYKVLGLSSHHAKPSPTAPGAWRCSSCCQTPQHAPRMNLGYSSPWVHRFSFGFGPDGIKTLAKETWKFLRKHKIDDDGE